MEMKWLLPLFLFGSLAIFPDLACGDPPDKPTLPKLSSNESPPPDHSSAGYLPSPSLLRQSTSASFHLVLGRLQLDPVRYRKGSQSLRHLAATNGTTTNANTADTSETMTVSSARGIPSMHYDMSGPLARVTIDAQGQGIWRVETRRVLSQGVRRVLVEQTPGQPLRMAFVTSKPGAAAKPSVIEGATWLHLREAERELFDEDLEPILRELLAPYHFREMAEAAQRAALSQAEMMVVQDEAVDGWIEDLRSPFRSVRMDAERKLVSMGISLLPRLATLDVSTLDAEQTTRLNQIRERLTPLIEDDAARLAVLIRDDMEYWRLAARRLDDSQMQLVETRLARMRTSDAETSTDASRVASLPGR
jgi:signal transduction histidine kinase